MNLMDIISLAKAGYKKSDIDELLKTPVDEQEPDKGSDSKDTDTLSEGDKEEYPEKDIDESPDFENLYKETKEELENVKKQLADAQKKNIKINNDSDIDKSEAINDIFRSFM